MCFWVFIVTDLGFPIVNCSARLLSDQRAEKTSWLRSWPEEVVHINRPAPTGLRQHHGRGDGKTVRDRGWEDCCQVLSSGHTMATHKTCPRQASKTYQPSHLQWSLGSESHKNEEGPWKWGEGHPSGCHGKWEGLGMDTVNVHYIKDIKNGGSRSNHTSVVHIHLSHVMHVMHLQENASSLY